ncbi:unnamed protein product [Microthlaspi erraticum]|uniref:Reverse transcriptase Ty1/copia-type domain-containing protein n=1 Tax=Microthlaspi erraticum TaxID=1685480 RepID=A0A6D2KM91_9BRAS|nr:unnamed protein product [Microthlaspi erraticum]
MADAKSTTTPLATHFKLKSLTKAERKEEVVHMENKPYASAVGSLMYAMIGSRPDLAYAVGVISRFMSNPGREHWTAVKWVLRYLRGASKDCLTFTKNKEFSIEGFCDSDYATDIDKRRSVTGFIFQVWGNTISWRSNLQSVVALSTTEAEYMALTSAVREAIWLKGICEELGFETGAVKIHCDSQSALALAKNSVHHERTKHIATKYHFIRDIVAEETVKLFKIHISMNPADFLTKALPGPKFQLCCDLVNAPWEEFELPVEQIGAEGESSVPGGAICMRRSSTDLGFSDVYMLSLAAEDHRVFFRNAPEVLLSPADASGSSPSHPESPSREDKREREELGFGGVHRRVV